MEKLLSPELLAAMLPVLHCATLSAFLQSLHVVDVVTIVRPATHARQLEPLLRLSFDPQHALLSILDGRLSTLAGAVSDGVTASAAETAAQQEQAGAAPTHYRCAHMVREFVACHGISFSAALVGCPDMKSSLQLANALAKLTPSPHAKEWPMASPTAAAYLRRLLLQRLAQLPCHSDAAAQPAAAAAGASGTAADQPPAAAEHASSEVGAAAPGGMDAGHVEAQPSGSSAAASSPTRSISLSLGQLAQAFEAAYGFKHPAASMHAAVQELSWQFDIARDASDSDLLSLSLRTDAAFWPVQASESRRKTFVEFLQRALVAGEHSCVPRYEMLTTKKSGQAAAAGRQQQDAAAGASSSAAQPASTHGKRKRKHSTGTTPTATTAKAVSAGGAAPRQTSASLSRDAKPGQLSGKRPASEDPAGHAAKQANAQGGIERARQQQPSRQLDRSKPTMQHPAQHHSTQQRQPSHRAPWDQPGQRPGRDKWQAGRPFASARAEPAYMEDRQPGFERGRSRERDAGYRQGPDAHAWHPQQGWDMPRERHDPPRTAHDAFLPRNYAGPPRGAFKPRFDSFGVERAVGRDSDLMGGHWREPSALRYPPPDAVGHERPRSYGAPDTREATMLPQGYQTATCERGMPRDTMRGSAAAGPDVYSRTAELPGHRGRYAVESCRDSTEAGYARDGHRRDTSTRSNGTVYGINAPYGTERSGPSQPPHIAAAPPASYAEQELMPAHAARQAAGASFALAPRLQGAQHRGQGAGMGSMEHAQAAPAAGRGLYRREDSDGSAGAALQRSLSPRNERRAYHGAPTARPGSVYHAAGGVPGSGHAYDGAMMAQRSGVSSGTGISQGINHTGLQAGGGAAVQGSYAAAPTGSTGAPMQVVAIDPATGQQQTVVLPPGYQLVQVRSA